MNRKPAILAIESSCDETAVALVDESGAIVGEKLASQISIHQKYGGVVPEVASRSHFEVVDGLVKELEEEISRFQVISIAATRGPGLIGPLLVGASYGEGLARGWGIPFRGIHHLRGHLASALMSMTGPETLKEKASQMFPALVLLVSGGHTQILSVDSSLRATLLADTADDAAGECFDKSAKLMGLPYPGGPLIEKLALQLLPQDKAQAQALSKDLPRPKSQEGGFSFSGLKTAVRLRLEKDLSLKQNPAFCWALQEAIADTLVAGLNRSLKARPLPEGIKHLVFCGGVSANQRLRAAVGDWAHAHELEISVPPLKHCTDNAAMIATAAWVQDLSLDLPTVSARVPL